MVFFSLPIYVFLANFAIFEPYIYPLHLLQNRARETMIGRITVGPYPDYELLSHLKIKKYDLVVSLLDPNLIYEKSLTEKERDLVKKVDIPYFNFPMNSSEPPTSPKNARAIENFQKLLVTYPNANVYVHCYLGKHRAVYILDLVNKSQK